MIPENKFNNSSHSLLWEYLDAGSSVKKQGVVLPHSEKILTLDDICRKILSTNNHKNHLTAQLSNRFTDGGKRLRSKKVSISNQILQATERLGILKKAHGMLLDGPFYNPLAITEYLNKEGVKSYCAIM